MRREAQNREGMRVREMGKASEEEEWGYEKEGGNEEEGNRGRG